jgi:hypothetical protein
MNLRASDCLAPSSCAWHKGCPAQWRGRIKEKEWGEKYFIGGDFNSYVRA